jgi:hypothetical protein
VTLIPFKIQSIDLGRERQMSLKASDRWRIIHRKDTLTVTIGYVGQGMSVALSADGNTAIVGGWRAEGAWVFTRSDGVWTQQGKKLVGTGAVGSSRQGMSVALSADGNIAIVGGWSDNAKLGAAWYSAATAVSGPSKARSLSAPALWEAPAKARLSRCPPTATPPS